MNIESVYQPSRLAASLALMLGLSGCLGGSDSSSTTLSGTAMAGPFLSGNVCAYQVSNGAKGARIGSCTSINASSGFSFDLGDYTGDVLVEIEAGARYDDETNAADDTTGTLLTGTLRNLIRVASTGGNLDLAVTPLTEAALRLAGSTLNDSTVQAAIAQLSALLPLESGLDLRTTLPLDTTAAGLAYREALRAVSQLQWGTAGGGQFANNLDGYLGNLVGQIDSDGNSVGADLLGQIEAGLSSNCGVTGGVLSCTVATGGGGGNDGGGNGGGSLTCNMAGTARVPTSTELASFAKTYNGNTGSFDMNGFTANGAATLVFSSSGGLTYNGTAQSVQSVCYENNATYGAMLFVAFGNSGAVDLFTANSGGFSGNLPDLTGLCGNAPGCPAGGSGGSGGASSSLSIPGSRSISSAASVTYLPIPNQPGKIITFSENGVSVELYDYQATQTLGIAARASGFSIGVAPLNACALDPASVDAYTPSCSSVGVTFDRTTGQATFTSTPMHPIIFTCPGTCELSGNLSFTPY